MQVCKYYMLNGTCKFGMACNLHHPNIRPKNGGDVITSASSFKHAVPIEL